MIRIIVKAQTIGRNCEINGDLHTLDLTLLDASPVDCSERTIFEVKTVHVEQN